MSLGGRHKHLHLEVVGQTAAILVLDKAGGLSLIMKKFMLHPDHMAEDARSQGENQVDCPLILTLAPGSEDKARSEGSFGSLIPLLDGGDFSREHGGAAPSPRCQLPPPGAPNRAA